MSKMSAIEKEQLRVAAEDAYGPFGAEYVVKLMEANPTFDLADVVDVTMNALTANEEFLEAVVAIHELRKAHPSPSVQFEVPRREFKSRVKALSFGSDTTK